MGFENGNYVDHREAYISIGKEVHICLNSIVRKFEL